MEFHEIYIYINLASYAIILVFATAAVVGNAVILATIWKKSFKKKKTFYILLSGLAFTDLCTGLTSPLLVVPFVFLSLGKSLVFLNSMLTIGKVITVYMVAFTLLMIAIMSVERWLHMSRRSLVTSRRGVFTAAMLSLVQIPLVVLSTLNATKGTLGVEVSIAVYMVCCYLTTSVAYFKAYRIIRQHQQQLQGHQPYQNFGQPAINFAKYKKSVVTISYILVLFSVCFLRMIVWLVVTIIMDYNIETMTAYSVSLLLLFLSSSINPGIYIWRMKDVRDGVKKLLCTNR